MEEKDVVELIPESEMSDNKWTLHTVWEFQLKVDEVRNAYRYHPRLCARGVKKTLGVDFLEFGDVLSSCANGFTKIIRGTVCNSRV